MESEFVSELVSSCSAKVLEEESKVTASRVLKLAAVAVAAAFSVVVSRSALVVLASKTLAAKEVTSRVVDFKF